MASNETDGTLTAARRAEIERIMDRADTLTFRALRDLLHALDVKTQECERLTAALEDWRAERDEIRALLGLMAGSTLSLPQELARQLAALPFRTDATGTGGVDEC